MTDQAKPPRGEIRGTAVVRDASGNIKSTFEFGGPTDMTAEEFQAKLRGADSGSDPDECSA